MEKEAIIYWTRILGKSSPLAPELGFPESITPVSPPWHMLGGWQEMDTLDIPRTAVCSSKHSFSIVSKVLWPECGLEKGCFVIWWKTLCKSPWGKYWVASFGRKFYPPNPGTVNTCCEIFWTINDDTKHHHSHVQHTHTHTHLQFPWFHTNQNICYNITWNSVTSSLNSQILMGSKTI